MHIDYVLLVLGKATNHAAMRSITRNRNDLQIYLWENILSVVIIEKEKCTQDNPLLLQTKSSSANRE